MKISVLLIFVLFTLGCASGPVTENLQFSTTDGLTDEKVDDQESVENLNSIQRYHVISEGR